MALPLLTTKLHMPSPRPALVLRPRLVERLDAGAHCALTLVSAPAGFGKTTLVAAWLREAGYPCAWLSLEEEDNDPLRFLTYLVAALQRIDPQIGRSVQAMLQAPPPAPPEVLLTSLINDIAATGQRFVLVLDDYHVIHILPIHQQLAYLVEHQPQHMRMVIATREDPPLPLSRLRARGQMVELRQAELRCTPQETAEFLQHTMGLALSPTNLAALHQRTEGWIAGLQLLALSLQRSQDADGLVRSFISSPRYVLDYLIDEVFRRQQPAVQDFMLKTSILERLTASLCDAVVEGDSSHALLLALEHANLFLVPLDESGEWYRYHQLFADLLRHRLQIEAEDLIPSLHQRASRWYEAAGYIGDAVHHALAARDWERACDLILGASSEMLQRAETAALLRWCQALPEEQVRARPHLLLDYSWALILSGQFDSAESALEAAEEYALEIPVFLGGIAAARGHIARARGDAARAIALLERALALFPTDDDASRSVVGADLGIAHWSSGHLAEAHRALSSANRSAERSGNGYATLVTLGFLGVVQASWGKLYRARELYERAIRLSQGSPAAALAHNELGALFYEWNDLAAAAEHLQRGMALGKRSANVEIQTGNYRLLALLRQAQGDGAAALGALEELHRMSGDHHLSPLVCARNAACQVQVALAQQDMPAALRWAARVTEEADAAPFYPRLGLTPARILLAEGRAAEAAVRLETCAARAAEGGWQYGLIVVRALQALAAPTVTRALGFLAEALALAEPEGYIRTFVDLGPPMAELLRHASLSGSLAQYAARLLVACTAQQAAQEERPPAGSPLVEPLSDRENEVLLLLADGQTNQEIALGLIISVNTVKAHLKSIYGKLDVHTRRQAVLEARRLGLLP